MKAFSDLGRWVIKILIHPTIHLLDRSDFACYYPVFRQREELVNHYFRALWYLPAYPKACSCVEFVKVFVGDDPQPKDRPACMGEAPGKGEHFVISCGSLRLWRALFRSRNILTWRSTNKFFCWLLRLSGKKVYNVTTDDITTMEYQNYTTVLWNMLPKKDRQSIVAKSRKRFLSYSEQLRYYGFTRAYVFGTGPTLEDAYDFEFHNGIRIMCNSAAGNRKLFNHIQPHFLAAIDEVSHLGVSRYAENFRRELFTTLRQSNLMFVTLAQYGFILTANHPEIIEKTLLIPCQTTSPNYDLFQEFRVPGFESVLTSVMLPLASSLTKIVYFLGCDGRSKVRNNEDFWAHGKGAQYDADLVASGHQCHPTFNIRRQAITYNKYNNELALIIETGEQEHQMIFRTLRPSNTPVLKGRLFSSRKNEMDTE